MRLKFNACPKCSGDLEMRRDIYGMFVSCLQCGWQRDLDAPNQAVEFAKPKHSAIAATATATVRTARKELLKAA